MNQLFKTVSGVGEHGGKTFWFKRLSVDEYIFFGPNVDEYIAGLVSRVKKKATHSVPDYKMFFYKIICFY